MKVAEIEQKIDRLPVDDGLERVVREMVRNLDRRKLNVFWRRFFVGFRKRGEPKAGDQKCPTNHVLKWEIKFQLNVALFCTFASCYYVVGRRSICYPSELKSSPSSCSNSP